MQLIYIEQVCKLYSPDGQKRTNEWTCVNNLERDKSKDKNTRIDFLGGLLRYITITATTCLSFTTHIILGKLKHALKSSAERNGGVISGK